MNKHVLGTLLGVTSLSLSLAGCGLGNAPAIPSAKSGQGLVGLNLAVFRADGVARSQVLVSFKGPMSAADLKRFEARTGLQVKSELTAIHGAVVSVTTSPETAIAKLEADPAVASAEFDRAALVDDVTVNDPSRGRQYALDKVHAGAAWERTMGSEDVTIAIVDTGVDLDHPDLRAKLLKGHNTIEPNTPPKDDYGHGTHVAGIAAAVTNNGLGIAGLASRCKILPVRVLGNGSGSAASVAQGIIWAADHGADVINMSLGFYDQPVALGEAVAYALRKNVVVVATMGNDNSERKRYPAGFPGVIAVGSTDQVDKRSGFSNYGDWISVSAPGSDILSTFPTYPVGIGGTPGYSSLSGTSMAAPLVTGLCGLIRSQHKDMAPAEVKALVESTAQDLGDAGFDKYFGHGRIDAFQAVSR